MALDSNGQFHWTIYQHRARAALEAAAPHMLAEAWEAWHRTCRLDPGSIEFNPYRARTDREPEPGDGPDYHAEHAAWEARQNK